MRHVMLVALATVCAGGPAIAFEKLEGFFIASKACEAYQSKNRLTNPGDVVTEPSKAYVMRGLNAAGGDYFQIIVPGAPVVTERWVSIGCGTHVVDAGTPVAPQPSGGHALEPAPGTESADNLLALSWQPAFCESKSSKTECKQLNDGMLPVTEQQFSLHGLWPQPRGNDYCGVPGSVKALDTPARWEDLPPPTLTPETRERLDVVMPGTASHLHHHEWIKHGTCFKGAGGAEEYFRDSLAVTDAINNSAVAEFLAAHIGAEVETSDIRARFDEAFGTGAGNRVQFHCAGDGQRVLLVEVTIGLKGTISEQGPLSDLILAADEVSLGCPRGVIDAAGLQ